MSSLLRLICAIILIASPAFAQERLTAVARIDPDASAVRIEGRDLVMRLAVSQAIPWRVYLQDMPPAVVLELSDIAPGTAPIPAPGLEPPVIAGGAGGWTKVILPLDRPRIVDSAHMKVGEDGANLTVRLSPASQDAFSGIARPAPVQPAVSTDGALPVEDRRPVIVIDPGHGGIDPGAEAEGTKESDIVLAFARELKEALLRSGLFDVVLTRDDDVFVPVRTRVTLARDAGAAALLSLHADSLAEGDASGASVYTLDTKAAAKASRSLAARHEQGDILSGVTLDEPGDQIPLVLMDLARTETAPRSEALGAALVEGFRAEGLELAGTPHRHADLSVVSAADIPSVLIELGFLSTEADRRRLSTPEWRARAARAVAASIADWATEDAVRAGLKRN